MSLELDHLVVAAATLDDGVGWCEAVLGVVPDAGGRHALMGTHNRVLAVGSPRFPRAYLEIIAIDATVAAPRRPRWFDLDDRELQAQLARGPALIHWVARCRDVAAECAAWRGLGIDRGEVLAAERETPGGMLRWRIAVRADGRRLADGAVPTLIEWGDRHPADALPPRGVSLLGLDLCGVPEALDARLPDGVRRRATGAALAATLSTPRGRVTLESPR